MNLNNIVMVMFRNPSFRDLLCIPDRKKWCDGIKMASNLHNYNGAKLSQKMPKKCCSSEALK
jgi:hypothetical protein